MQIHVIYFFYKNETSINTYTINNGKINTIGLSGRTKGVKLQRIIPVWTLEWAVGRINGEATLRNSFCFLGASEI